MHLDIAKEFLKGAEVALANELYRVAAANSYYAMFWAAQAALRHVGIIREEWSHGGLQQAFGLELIKKRGLATSRLGDWLNRAYELRCDAHYKEHGVGVKETRRLVQHANEFVAKAEEVTAK
ncbi:HEPN domain-containing protein [Candidatus Poribacteria bacterium]|nr:HEPN domain-containing protein [Candidatus Poribacteria bacterium]